MACMKLGSKSDMFHLDGQTWLCCTGLPSDIIIEVGEISFHLHKKMIEDRYGYALRPLQTIDIPELCRKPASRLLENLIQDSPENKKFEDEKKCILQLHDIPGGAKSFLLVAKFCYGVKIELTAINVVSLRCAAEYLQMKEDHGEGNLISQTETFLNEVFGSWTDSIKALETCEEVLPHAEELHVVARCVDSLAHKACSDPSLIGWPVSGHSATQSLIGTVGTSLWNGICTASKPQPVGKDWWYEDVCFLKLPLYKRLILAVDSKGMAPERIAGSLMFYAKKYLPLSGRQSNIQDRNHAAPVHTLPVISEADQKTLLEEVVELLPNEKGVTPSKLLLRLLRTSMILHASPICREKLEKKIGIQLDQAALEDLLIPNMGYSVETLYDIDCIQRIVDHFMLVEQERTDCTSNCLVDEGQLMEVSHSLTPATMVANLVDNYLAEVAPDVNLKFIKFQSLAASIPDYARHLDDGLYRAIDIYLKAHPWLTDSEREQLCRLMNCQKLSIDACMHAAQNERLPLRVIVQVLFFEQLRLRTSVAGWFFVSDNIETSGNPSGGLPLPRNYSTNQGGSEANQIITVDDMKERVSELEKECSDMKEEIERLVNTKKGSWNSFFKRFGLRLKFKACDPKLPKMPCYPKVLQPSRKAVLNKETNQ